MLSEILFQQPVDQRRASLPRLPVDQHGARTADLFQAVAVPSHWRGHLAVGSGSLCGDLLQNADHIEVRLVGDPVPLPIAGLAWAVLTENADFKRRWLFGLVGVSNHSVVNPVTYVLDEAAEDSLVS